MNRGLSIKSSYMYQHKHGRTLILNMNLLDCVDSHFHIWDLKRFSYPWPSQADSVLYKNFLADDLQKAKKDTPVQHSIFVQVLNNCPEESRWVSELAKEYPFIRGIVAGLDVTDENFRHELDSFKDNSLIVGVRHILDFEDENWLARDDVITGLKVLEERGLTFDLLLKPHLMKHVPRLSKELPKLKMVVDHIAKPFIKDGLIREWSQDMLKIASNPNIYCKLSGLVTEANLESWTLDDFKPYVKRVLECFGPERCMYGSDWPVCALAGASYADVFNLTYQLINELSPGNEQAIFRDNAVKFYKLNV